MKKRICFALLSIALFSSIAAARAEDSPNLKPEGKEDFPIPQEMEYSHN
jgi:hypothetical protein